ncbi:MAG: UDP-4-amino-4,6-dideoxy-N-acetyl-beta-L-altrosamine transaminase [Spirochaetales bacterium]|nr:UDP-4-amino-4,6-dideoxy-N-acetyl-beta-L-altrosamine transaminase [Spirochaetales bacterium]
MFQIPYGRQNITAEDMAAVAETLQSPFLTQGPKIAEFERAFADYVGARYAVAVTNGTAALHLCALALDVRAGQRVITSPITFVASANCVRYCGGEVNFVDVDPRTALLDLDLLERRLESESGENAARFSGVIPVDFAGHPVDMERLRTIADRFGLWIIEDACHAPGASFADSRGETVKAGDGRYADLAIFSFHPVKHIACGEGGMITTNREDLYERLQLLRSHGITKEAAAFTSAPDPQRGAWYYEMQTLGFNYRMPDILAALGLSQLERADAGIERRREIAAAYDRAFQGGPVRPLESQAGFAHAYHLYVVRVPNRRQVFEALRDKGVFCQVHYIPVHLQPYYRELGYRDGDFPHAESYYEEALSLPMFPTLTEEEQAYVIERLLEAVDD